MIHIGVEGIRPSTLASRRGFLRTSLALAGSLSLPRWLQARAEAAPASRSRRDTAVIQLWLGGGPSQYETYDLKPAAPEAIRGAFKPIATNVPGLRICELLPRQARLMDKLALIRSLHHTTNDHHAAIHWMQTGHFGPLSKFSPEQTRPAAGSAVSALRGANRRGMVPNVLIANDSLDEPTLLWNFGPAYLGPRHAPLRIKPARVGQHRDGAGYFDDLVGNPQFDTNALALLSPVSVDRLHDRGSLLPRLDQLRRVADRGVAAYDEYRQRALELVTSDAALRAFDLSQESVKVREHYGNNVWGQSALLARRLVEAGVTWVTVNTDAYSLAWDSHTYLARDFKKMLPVYDQMLTALVEDLVERGLYDRVLLLVMGEFGRTAKLNDKGGRDHWGPAGVALLGGAGIRGGAVLGATNSMGDAPRERPVTPGDILATAYHVLGIDPKHEFHDRTGRPVPVLSEGEAIRELL